MSQRAKKAGQGSERRSDRGGAEGVCRGLTGGVHCSCSGQMLCGMTEWVARLFCLFGAAGRAPSANGRRACQSTSALYSYRLISRQPVHRLKVPFPLADRFPRKGVPTGATGGGGGCTASFLSPALAPGARRGSANATRQDLFHHGRRSVSNNKTTRMMLRVRRRQLNS